jgi:hypothetical protein
MTDIIYGTPHQINVVKRSTALWALLRNDPRLSFQGRTVSLADATLGGPDIVIALARLEGYSSCHFVPYNEASSYTDAYEVAGLNPAIWNQFWGRETALTASKEFLSDYTHPNGLTLKTVTDSSTDDTIRAICETSVNAGVLPVPGSIMRGKDPKGIMLYVEDQDNRVLAAGGAYMSYHPNSPRFDEAFWGMLATHEAARGQRLACWLGAELIMRMADQYGARGFSSGVKSDNPASQAMCKRLGVNPSDMVYAGATAPLLMGNAPITR